MNWKVFSSWALIGLAIVGVMDATYLTYEHFAKVLPPCTVSAFADCGKVLQSEYAVIYGIPLSLLGMVHYIVLFGVLLLAIFGKDKFWHKVLFLMTAIGLIVSLYLVYLQLFVIGAIRQYCMISAIDSLLMYVIARFTFKKEYKVFFHMKKMAVEVFFVRPIRQAFTGKKHHYKKTDKKLGLRGLEAKSFKFITNFLPKDKVDEFVHELTKDHT